MDLKWERDSRLRVSIFKGRIWEKVRLIFSEGTNHWAAEAVQSKSARNLWKIRMNCLPPGGGGQGTNWRNAKRNGKRA